MAANNPFHSQERVNFPAFSPSVFTTIKTPSSTEGSDGKSFGWTIDEIARLNPADIATDMQSFVSTNGYSPAVGPEVQQSVDKFFSQRTIHPSPWSIDKPKHVTFSPHPPTMTYYDELENYSGTQNSANACTQTALSIPINYDLEKKLGAEFYIVEDTDAAHDQPGGGGIDIANASLIRRKLFGQPQRDSMNISDCSEQGDNTSLSSPDNISTGPSLGTNLPIPTFSVTPEIVTRSLKDNNCSSSLPPPLSSSLLTAKPTLDQLPSPIGGLQSTGCGSTPINSLPSSSSISSASSSTPLSSVRGRRIPGVLVARHIEESAGLLSTPCPRKKSGSSKWSANREPVSPIMMTTPANCQSAATMAAMAVPSFSNIDEKNTSQQSTSTPYYQKQVKRQLPLSPLASPVMKEKHCNTEGTDDEHDRKEEGQEEGDETGLDVPEPLLLADLQSEVVDMTTSNAYFPHNGNSTAQVESISARPLHSLLTSSPWLPRQHSTMLHRPPQASADSGVINCQDSTSSSLHPTKSGIDVASLTSHPSSLRPNKLVDSSESMMEVSVRGRHQVNDTDSGILAMSGSGTGYQNGDENAKMAEASSSAHSLKTTPIISTLPPPPPPPPPPPLPPPLPVRAPSSLRGATSCSRDTPMTWLSTAKLNLPHTSSSSNRIFTTENTDILPTKLKVSYSSSSSSSSSSSCPLSTNSVTSNQHYTHKTSPISDELLRRKAYLKAKMNFNSHTNVFADENVCFQIKTAVHSSTRLTREEKTGIRSPLLERHPADTLVPYNAWTDIH